MPDEDTIWKWYFVELHILERIYGGLPKDPKIIEGFLKGKDVAPEVAKTRAPIVAEEVDSSMPEGEDSPEGMWTGFKKDEEGIYVETRQIKAMLKEACGESEMWRSVRGLKSRLGGAVFPKGEGGTDLTRIYLYRDGKKLTEPDGYEEGVGHVSGPQGRRSILKRKDYVEGITVSFFLKVGGKTVKFKILQDLFVFAEELGLGADRSCEKGKFKVVTLEKVEEEEALKALGMKASPAPPE